MMRFIAIIPTCLCFISSCLAAPSQFLNFAQKSASQFSFGFNGRMTAPFIIDNNPEALRNVQSEIKEGTRTNFDQELEKSSKESLPISVSPGSPIASMSVGRSFDFRELGTILIKEFGGDFNFLLTTKENADFFPSLKDNYQLSAMLNSNVNLLNSQEGNFKTLFLPKSEGNILVSPGDVHTLPIPTKPIANSLPLPESDTNFFPVLKENTNFSSVPKDNANSLLLHKSNANFSPFPTTNADFPPPLKGDANPLSKGNANFPSFSTVNVGFPILSKDDANSLPLPKGNVTLPTLPTGKADFPSLLKEDINPLSSPKGNANFSSFSTVNAGFPSLPKSDANSLPLPKDNDKIPTFLAENVKDTPEVTAAREAHLRVVAETASKLTEPVKDTPEVIAAREALLRAAANPEAAISTEAPKYTPEVQAAREAHFRAYALAAKLAAESDVNPKILEQLLGRPGEPAQKTDEIFRSFVTSSEFSEELKRSMGTLNLSMTIHTPATKSEMPEKSLPQSTDSRGINNLMEKPQMKASMKPAEIIVETGATESSASFSIPDAKLASLNEFEQAKIKAASDLMCSTGLRVKDLNKIKSTQDRHYTVIRTGEFVPITSIFPLPTDQLERWKNWSIQYISL